MPIDNPGPAPAVPPPLTPFKSLLVTVSEGIANGNQGVIDDAAGVLITRARKKRAEAIVAAHDTLDGLKREDNKIRPDVVSYNADKSIASSTWSMGQLKKKEESANKIKKYTSALDKAVGLGVYDELLKLKGGSSAPADDDEAEVV